MKKKHFLLAVSVLLPIIAILLWPLSSAKFNIEIDRSAYTNKISFLESLTSDSVNDQPNILLIVVDDLGMADLSLYGDRFPNTPNIDKIGAGGVVFENAYVTSPVCSPSRAAILTGRYQQRFGFQSQIHKRYLKNRLEYLGFNYLVDSYPWQPRWMNEVPDAESISRQGIPPSEILLPELLKKKGFDTALIGKWHLGTKQQRTPCDFSFDYQFGFYDSHSLYAYEKTPGIHDQKVEDFTDPHIWSGQRNGPNAIYKNCEEIHVTEYLTDRFADEAIEYFTNHKENPFFLYLSFNAPHTPLQAPESYMNLFKDIEDPVKRTYYAMIANLDDNIGKVMSSLESNGLDENTLVFFISDNGGAEYTRTTKNGQYKGGKLTNFEGGLKVPFIMRWKNHVKPQNFKPMVSSMDIFQTITEIVDIALPEDRIYDGVNLLPYVTGQHIGSPHEYLFWQRGFSKSIRDNHWKLSINEDSQDTILFNLQNDLFETQNLFVKQKKQAKKMAIIHKIWSLSLPQPLWPPMIYFHFKDGSNEYYFDL